MEHILNPLLAHEKWFVDEPDVYPADWGFFFEVPTLILVGAALGVALLWRWVAVRFLPLPELGWLRPLARLVPWVPRILGIHLGVSLLSLAVDDAYLAPQLVVPEGIGGVLLVLAEGGYRGFEGPKGQDVLAGEEIPAPEAVGTVPPPSATTEPG